MVCFVPPASIILEIMDYEAFHCLMLYMRELRVKVLPSFTRLFRDTAGLVI